MVVTSKVDLFVPISYSSGDIFTSGDVIYQNLIIKDFKEMNNKKKIAFIISSIILFLLISTVSYINARSIALKSLYIVTIHDKDSFQQVKNEIYDIVAPEVQRSLFDKEFPVDRNYPIITY